MIQLSKTILKQIWSFVCNQYLILFFIVTIGLKLAFFNTFIIKVTWPTNQYLSGIVFGFLGTAVILSPLYLARKQKNKLTIIVASLISIIILIDTIYFSYFASLPSVGLLESIGQTKDIGPAIGSLLQWWFLLYFIDIALVVFFQKPVSAFFEKTEGKHNIGQQGFKTAMLAIVITFAIFGIALWQMKLNSLSNVIDKGYDSVSTTQYYGLFGAHAVDIIRFIEEETTHLSSDQQKAIVEWVKNYQPSQITDNMTGIAKGKNVIIVQVESLGGFVINQTINNQEITPTLNQLAKTSQFFPNDRFIIGAGHTSDTDFVVNSSYFPLNDAAVFIRYGQDDFTSLPKTLVNNGYSADAYHGFNRNFWNRDVALVSLGYQKFFAADNYSKGAKMNMGLNDGDFLSETADYIKQQPKPSLSYAITLSSHVPFAITNQTKGLDFKISDYTDQVSGYLENINYTDRMLGKFFAKLKSEGLYDDSLILVYGDHTPVLNAFTAGTIKYDPTSVQEKEVPLFIKLPNETTGKTYPNQGTHMDITPTIFDLLGVKTSQLMFGQSLFAGGNNALKVCTDQLVASHSSGDCKSILSDEKKESELIIRYNQFNNLPKK